MASRILIVEDDPDFATSLELALGLVGLSAIIACSAEEAYQIIESDSEEIRMGFIDVKLPQEDGIVCLENILTTNPLFTGVIMTGFRGVEYLERARIAGAVEVLLKPFRMAHFMELANLYSGRGDSVS